MGITKRRTLTVALSLAILAFMLDLLTPLGLAIWLLYLFPLAVASSGIPRPVVLGLTTLCTVLVVLGFFSSPAGIAPQVEVVNRALIIGALWAGTLLLLQRRRTEESLRRLQEDTETRVRARTADLDVANRALQAEVAERTRAEDVLHRYRLLAEHARDIVLFVCQDGRILEANNAAVAAYGYPRETLLALTIQDLRAPDTHALTPRQMAQAESDGILFETIHRRRDGTTFPVEVSSRATTLGEEVVLLSIVRDITARKHAEQALATRTRHLEALRAVSEEITRELDLTRLLHLLIVRAAELVGAAAATLYLWEPEQARVVPAAWHGLGEWQGALRLRLGEGIAGTVAQTRRGLCANDYRSSPYAHPVTLQHTQLTASLGAPLLYREALVGVITLSHEGGRTFAPPDEELLQLFATHAAIAIENARLYATAQRALRQREAAEAELRRIVRAVEQSASIVVITDTTGAIEYVNPKFTEVTGYTGTEVRGQTPRILKSGHTAAAEYAHLWATLAAGREWRGELHNRRKDGTLYWEAASISPVRDAAGTITHYVAVKEDITARKAADAALRRYATHLEALRATTADITRELDLAKLLTLVIERAVGLLDGVSGAIYLCDPVTEDITPQAWVGHGDWLAAVRLRPGEGIAGTVIQQRHGLLENAFRTSPYAVAPFLDRTSHTAVLAEPLCYRDRVIGAVLVDRRECGFTDSDRDLLRLCADQAAIAIENARLFTTTQAALHTLRQAQDELVRSETLRGLGQMAAGIAHDLNNMLATILGQAELLRLQARQPEVEDGLQTLVTAASDGAAVVRRIRDFARQRGGGPLSACDLSALVPEALEITRPRWREEPRRHGIVIDAVTELANLPLVQGDPAEIREALTNLIFNAVDAMPQGGCLRVTGRVRDGQDDQGPSWWPGVPASPGKPPGAPGPRWVELAVADTGVGMTDEVRQRAFDPFFTTKGLHGTGLGLSVVYGIMERHGGRVHVTSTPGQGTTIVLQFRLASPDSVRPEPPAPPAVVPRRRILLVDDDPAVRHTLATLLRASGQDVIEAESGAAGLRCLETTPVDLVVTDLGMPDVTGWDVARAAKARQPDLPVVLLTGWGGQVEGEAPASVRVDRVLTKPVPRRAMLAMIAELTTRP